MYRKINLNNGLQVILNLMPNMESTTLGVWISVGSRDERETLSGISHFLEHMVFKGTPRRSNRNIKEEIEGRGGSLNGFTSEEMTCYLAKVSGRHLDVALDILCDMVFNASLKTRDVERERRVIIEEIKMYKDLPGHYVHDILDRLMWPKHSLGLPIAGDIHTVSAISREDLVNYKDLNYVPRRMAIVACGCMDPDRITNKIRRLFSINAKQNTRPINRFVNRQDNPRIKVLYKDTEQTRLSMGMHTFGRLHKDKYVLSLLHIVLGANMSSRLFEIVREKKGLAYEIGTEIKRYRETGAFIINAGIEHSKVVKAISVILKELKRIKNKPVLKQELRRAKEFFNVQLLMSLENTMEHMLWLGEHVVSTDIIPDKYKIIEEVNSITGDDLRRVAESIFTDRRLNLAIIGPIKKGTQKKIESELYL